MIFGNNCGHNEKDNIYNNNIFTFLIVFIKYSKKYYKKYNKI